MRLPERPRRRRPSAASAAPGFHASVSLTCGISVPPKRCWRKREATVTPPASPVSRSQSHVHGSPFGLPRLTARPTVPQSPERMKKPTSQSSTSRMSGRFPAIRFRYPMPALPSFVLDA